MEKFANPKEFILKKMVDRKTNFPEKIIAIGKGETEVKGDYEDQWTWYYDEQQIHYPCVFVDNLYIEKKE